LEAPSFDHIDGFVNILENVIKALPYLKLWRRFGLLGTSFPSTMAVIGPGASIIPRSEWRMYRLLARRLGQQAVRIPCFGDYIINHPEILSIDMRIVKPCASVRYAVDDGWLIAKGQNVRDYGFGQYRQLCRMVVCANQYSGPKFSSGDQYIYECSRGNASTGNLTTWRWVGTNHHLELVAREVSSFRVP